MLALSHEAALETSNRLCTVDQAASAGRCSMQPVGSIVEANVVLLQRFRSDTLRAQLEAITAV